MFPPVGVCGGGYGHVSGGGGCVGEGGLGEVGERFVVYREGQGGGEEWAGEWDGEVQECVCCWEGDRVGCGEDVESSTRNGVSGVREVCQG